MRQGTVGGVVRMIVAVLVFGWAGAGVAGELAPVNPYNGRQMREEVYEFAQKPTVKKEGEKWIITFASKGNCDATVSILDKDGKIIRHLASGVLGKNAPWPFQQNSLSQKVEWDGEDNMGNRVPAEVLKSCQVRVSLGLRAKFERNLEWEPANFPGSVTQGDKRAHMGELKDYVVARANDGTIYVFGYAGQGGIVTGGGIHVRAYKDGKYVKTVWPPSAKDLEKTLSQMGFRVAETMWGDKVWIVEGPASRYGPLTMRPRKLWYKNTTLEELAKEVFAAVGVPLAGQLSAWPEEIPGRLPGLNMYSPLISITNRMAVDRVRDELYVGVGWPRRLMRVDVRTGEEDKTWFTGGDQKYLDQISEVSAGPDGLIYLGVGNLGYCQYIIRLTREGNPVPFIGNDAVSVPGGRDNVLEGGGLYGELEKGSFGRVRPNALAKADLKGLWTGCVGHSNVHDRGLYVSPRGAVVVSNLEPSAFGRAPKYGIPTEGAYKRHGGSPAPVISTSYVAVWDRDGNLLTLNAVGDTLNGHGVAMDRDGSIYTVWGMTIPAEYKGGLVGIMGIPLNGDLWGGFGTLAKFRGGVPFPRAKVGPSENLSPGALKINKVGKVDAVEAVDNSLLWTYTGVIGQTRGGCTCHNLRYDMDYYARHWLPANYLHSIVVLDANANIIARLGRYGNADDTEEDLKAGRDGLRFVWPRAVAVSDKALYVADNNARRFIKAALSYAAEEVVAVP